MTSSFRLPTTAPKISFIFEGQIIDAHEGDSVAAALAASGIKTLRTTPVSGAGRGFYCMMGACFDCLVEIDGVANRQACMTKVRAGLDVKRQNGAAVVEK